MKRLKTNSKYYKFIFLISLFLIFSCKSEPVQVLIKASYLNSNKVKLNDDFIAISNSGNEYDIFELQPGKNSVSINGGLEKEFIIGKNGGLLNLAEEEFVLFPIKFSSKEKSQSLSICLPVIIDSLIIFEKSMGTNQEEIIKILSNKALMRSALFTGGQKFKSSDLFLNKNWNYNVNEKLPNSIKLKRPSDWDLEVKTKLMGIHDFLKLAQTSNEYNIQKIEDASLIKLIDDYN